MTAGRCFRLSGLDHTRQLAMPRANPTESPVYVQGAGIIKSGGRDQETNARLRRNTRARVCNACYITKVTQLIRDQDRIKFICLAGNVLKIVQLESANYPKFAFLMNYKVSIFIHKSVNFFLII